MTTRLVAAVAAGVLATATQAANATPDHHYFGGCSATAAADPTPNMALGGPTSWLGEAAVSAVALDERLGAPAPAAAIAVVCELVIDNRYTHVVVSAAGTGAAVGVAAIEFAAWPDSSLSICGYVTVEGEPHEPACRPVEQPVRAVAPTRV